MMQLLLAGCFAILLGLILMLYGGSGHSKVDINYYGLGVLAQAWFIVLLIGLLLILADAYLSK